MTLPHRATLLGYGALAVVIAVLGIRWLGADARSPGPGAISKRTGPQAAAAPVLKRAPEPAAVVHVAGAVERPGVYRLRGGSRVRDAVRRAGGAAAGADTAAVNLAARLSDGQQIIVPRRVTPGATPTPESSPQGAASAGPVSLGSATLESLDALDGVGPATAQKILDRRAESGGFSSVDELGEIPGIGPKKLDSLRRQLTP